MASIQALGIDVGSTTVKIVGVDAGGNPVWHILEQSEPYAEVQVERLLAQFSSILPVVATGYGRNLVRQATRIVTEITCHARGIYAEFRHSGTLLDIGGQDSKVIQIGPTGEVLDFAMNDKCAAGTGRFLENTARRLNVPLEQMGPKVLAAEEDVAISSTCTVFAESEIISLIARGVPLPSILRGLHRALIKRLVAMIQTIGLVPPLMLSGGVVQNPAICQMLQEELDAEVILPGTPQLMGALGAALIALERHPK